MPAVCQQKADTETAFLLKEATPVSACLFIQFSFGLHSVGHGRHISGRMGNAVKINIIPYKE